MKLWEFLLLKAVVSLIAMVLIALGAGFPILRTLSFGTGVLLAYFVLFTHMPEDSE